MSSLLCATLPSQEAGAFAEDLCYAADGGDLFNCNELACAPGDDSRRCQAQTLANAIQRAALADGGRSMVHTDATHVLAQAVGFDADTAYFIAAYNEATDLGQFVPTDRSGHALVDPAECEGDSPPAECELVTALIDGVTRLNLDTGGGVLHYGGPYNPDGDSLDGLQPDVHDAIHEVQLVNLRRWAFEEAPACTAGLTEFSDDGDLSSGSACWGIGLEPAPTLSGSIPVFSLEDPPQAGGVPFTAILGDQVLVDGEAPIYVDDIEAVVGSDNVAAARLGIYLHAVMDRVSHHVCGDETAISGPDGDENFVIEYESSECGVPIHGLRHAWEVGHPQDQLAPEDRTTENALAIAYDELLAYAQQSGIASAQAENAAYRAFVLGVVGQVLEIEDAQMRVDAMVEVFGPSGAACNSVFAACFEPLAGH